MLQETFDAGLQAFEKEGIQTITTLKEQLVSSNHAQTPAIEKRYQDVITRSAHIFYLLLSVVKCAQCFVALGNLFMFIAILPLLN